MSNHFREGQPMSSSDTREESLIVAKQSATT